MTVVVPGAACVAVRDDAVYLLFSFVVLGAAWGVDAIPQAEFGVPQFRF